MANVEIHNEVIGDSTDGWHLCFQGCTYRVDDGHSEDEYRFIWRDGDGGLRPQRGQARIPTAGHMFRLLGKASDAGWF